MATEDRRARERAARRRLIVDTARRLAEADGWDAVTTRRLATEIEYSQPVLYKHFAGMGEIADAVALDGFAVLAQSIRDADGDTPRENLTRIAICYLEFAKRRPAVYAAMFSRTSGLRFTADDAPGELADAFASLREAIGRTAEERDPDTLTELFWAGLHGLATLGSTGRLRSDHATQRVQLLIDLLVPGDAPSRFD